MEKPESRLIKTPRDAEHNAELWLKWMGFEDAQLTGQGADGGVDVVSDEAVAQVKMEAKPIGRPAIQQIFGIAAKDQKKAIVFALAGYTPEAKQWATEAGVALFEFDYQGQPEPKSEAAEQLITGTSSPKTTRWLKPHPPLPLGDEAEDEIKALGEFIEGVIEKLTWEFSHASKLFVLCNHLVNHPLPKADWPRVAKSSEWHPRFSIEGSHSHMGRKAQYFDIKLGFENFPRRIRRNVKKQASARDLKYRTKPPETFTLSHTQSVGLRADTTQKPLSPTQQNELAKMMRTAVEAFYQAGWSPFRDFAAWESDTEVTYSTIHDHPDT